jgi:thioredoxin 1
MLKAIIILIIGAGAGAAMGYFGKCNNGQCPLTANPLRGSLWGLCLAMIIAYPMIVDAFRKPVPESENIIHIKTPEELESIISAPGKLCLIDFYADWCGPCRRLAPTINRLADEFKGRADIIKINIDKFSPLAQKYGANSIPTVIITKDGKQVEKIIGANRFEKYAEALEKYKENQK